MNAPRNKWRFLICAERYSLGGPLGPLGAPIGAHGGFIVIARHRAAGAAARTLASLISGKRRRERAAYEWEGTALRIGIWDTESNPYSARLIPLNPFRKEYGVKP